MKLISHYVKGASSTNYRKVKGDASPYDGSKLSYWGTRLGRHPEMSNLKASLLKEQKGKCAYCGNTFFDRDLTTMEVDHIIPKSLGGTDGMKNLQLLHGHCHDKKTASDGSVTKGLLTKLEKQYRNTANNQGDSIGKIHPKWARFYTEREMLAKVYLDEEERKKVARELNKDIENLSKEEEKVRDEIWQYIHKRSWEIEEEEAKERERKTKLRLQREQPH
jgi:uncharacterized protein (TIGR02646 family)